MSRANGQEVIPSAKRLIKSLRDIGYDFPTAVADLVDNSIEAGATLVTININFNGDDSWVRIADNGSGMNLDQLREAMRYGSERVYDEEKDLGKFGLGLKTASMSQCRRMIVATRSNAIQQEIFAYSWDIEHVDATNKWEIIKVPKRELRFVVDDYLDNSTGTVVFWSRLDRILGYKHPYGEMARKRLNSMCRELEEHLSMVFHRFLAGEVPGKLLRIKLNDVDILPWDPFMHKEPKTRVLDPVSIPINFEGKVGTVLLSPYVLPHQDGFSSREAFTLASGPKKWNRQQGFYIYRADRLIQSGGWCGLKTIDEHTKLARIALSFSPLLDDAFKINVAKMRVQLPSQIKDQIENVIKSVTKLAQETYRKSTIKSDDDKPVKSLGDFSTSKQYQPDNLVIPSEQIPLPILTTSSNPSQNKYWTLDELKTKLEEVAKVWEKPILSRIFERFENKLGK